MCLNRIAIGVIVNTVSRYTFDDSSNEYRR